MFNREDLSGIAECMAIREALSLISYDSWLLLDLDNTVMTAQSELGSDQWFVSLFMYCSDAILIYHAIQHFIRTIPVEQDIVWMIRRLQDIGVPVVGITARDPCLSATTQRQLYEIGIDFSRHPPEGVKDGILYCSGKDKGECFRAFLEETSHRPGHIVMLDDKQKHLTHVADVAKDRKIRFHGLRYGHMDEQVKKLDMETATNELALVSGHLPEEVQACIDRHNLIANAKPHAIGKCRAHLFYFEMPVERHPCCEQTCSSSLQGSTTPHS